MENLYTRAPLQPQPIRVSSTPIRVMEANAPIAPMLLKQLREYDRFAAKMQQCSLVASIAKPILRIVR
jgi:hypothetical protein